MSRHAVLVINKPESNWIETLGNIKCKSLVAAYDAENNIVECYIRFYNKVSRKYLKQYRINGVYILLTNICFNISFERIVEKYNDNYIVIGDPPNYCRCVNHVDD